MQVRFQRTAVALCCTAIAATPVFAQNSTSTDSTKQAKAGAPSQCEANIPASEALARTTFSMQRAFQALEAKRDPTKDLKDAIRTLTTPPKDKAQRIDSLGRDYYLGQAYIMMLQAPGVKAVGRRGDYGIATDTVLTIDILAAADTVFRKAETGMPLCASEIAKWRQQKPWLDLLNGAVAAANAGQFDSADVLAKRVLIIDRTTPYPYSILASVANNRKDYNAASEDLKQALAIAGKDTIYNESRIGTIYEMATTATLRAQAATGADKNQLAQEAIAAWHTFIPIGTKDPQVANGVQNIVQLYKSMGDSSKISDAYAQVLADPSKFGESTLLNSGVIATRARKPEDATKFFSAVIDQNPNQRDALNNLAASYVEAKQPDKMFPLVDRLVSIDPDNPDNWMLYAYAYTGLLKGAKDPKLVKGYTDSLMKYNSKAEKLTSKVLLTEFSHGQQATTLSGTVENLSTTAKSYTLDIDFLDKTGSVVGSQSVNVGPVAPKDVGTFTATTPSANAVAFRYKPLPQ